MESQFTVKCKRNFNLNLREERLLEQNEIESSHPSKLSIPSPGCRKRRRMFHQMKALPCLYNLLCGLGHCRAISLTCGGRQCGQEPDTDKEPTASTRALKWRLYSFLCLCGCVYMCVLYFSLPTRFRKMVVPLVRSTLILPAIFEWYFVFWCAPGTHFPVRPLALRYFFSPEDSYGLTPTPTDSSAFCLATSGFWLCQR